MATASRAAVRYAKAFGPVLAQTKAPEKTLAELRAIDDMLRGHAELWKWIHSPAATIAQSHGVLEDLRKKAAWSDLSDRILKTLVETRRLPILNDIVDKLEIYLWELQSIAPIQVASATELTADEKKRVEAKFASALGKQVRASFEVVPGLIGGIKVSAGGRTYDGTIDGWLRGFEAMSV